MKIFPVILLAVFACGMGAKRPAKPIPPVNPNDGVEILPARTERLIKIEVTSLKGFDGNQELRFRNIVANLNNVVNLKAFEDEVKAHSYNGKSMFVDTSDTPAMVYEKVTSADWKLEYRLESIRSSTIGYTYPNVSWIALNSKKWYSLTDDEIAANICHEYGGHKFGRYSHAKTWSRSRDFSGPYGLGTICSNLYKRTVTK